MESQSVSTGLINLKPNKPELYDGRRDYLVANTWLYKVEQYLTLLQLTNPALKLSDAKKIMYASTFLTNKAAVWWYTLIQANQAPPIWDQFKMAMIGEFVPEDQVRRARDKLRKLKQTSSVAKFLAKFRNIVLTIPDITDGENWDKFCAGLKYEIRLEVMKSTVTSFEEAAKIALRVDSALWSAGTPSGSSPSSAADVPTPMEIGNLEGRRRQWTPQRLKDYRNNACFVCHKVGRRPWKHKRETSVSNVEIEDGSGKEEGENGSDSQPEN